MPLRCDEVSMYLFASAPHRPRAPEPLQTPIPNAFPTPLSPLSFPRERIWADSLNKNRGEKKKNNNNKKQNKKEKKKKKKKEGKNRENKKEGEKIEKKRKKKKEEKEREKYSGHGAVGRADAALGGANVAAGQLLFLEAVDANVAVGDDVASVRQLDAGVDVLQALGLEGGQLAEEGGHVDDGAGADQVLAVWVQEARGEEI
jgi:hypothetical protein